MVVLGPLCVSADVDAAYMDADGDGDDEDEEKETLERASSVAANRSVVGAGGF